MTREFLCGFLWPEADQPSAYAYLRHTLWEIGSIIDPTFLNATRETVELSANQNLWIDALRFETNLGRWKAQPDDALLEDAVGLYQADFLDRFSLKDAEDFDAWQREKSAQYRNQFSEALENLAGILLAKNDAERTLLHARRWLSLDNLNEAAHRMIIRAEQLAGRRSAALQQYETCVRVLSTELGITPAAETRALLDEIRGSPVEPDPQRTPAPVHVTSRPAAAAPRQDVLPTAIPRDPAPFIGRRMELGEISYRLKDPDCRLLTLLGPGGIGKTRLALRAAEEMMTSYRDGVVFVPLVSISQPEEFLPLLAATVHLQTPASEGVDLLPRLIDFLSDRSMLIILDNMEHLTACADTIQTILTAGSDLNILTTSRERLNLPAEWCLEVGGMSYPFLGDASFEEYSAVQLFLLTARRVKANFQHDRSDREAIARICRLLDGMPLGIELAATWMRLLPPQEILREIENSLDFLTSGQRGIPERHRSLRAIYEGSQEMLSPAERAAFHRLASIPGSFSREDAVRLADVNLPLLTTLVDKSLVRFHQNGRYDLHEVLRKYAADQVGI